jgi:acetoin utilization deacetylase AcuC-like enzyme
MQIIYTDAHLAHNPAYEIYEGELEPYSEAADRGEVIINEIRRQKLGTIISPQSFPLEHIYAIHQKQYVEFIKNRSSNLSKEAILYPSYFITDTYAPIVAGTYDASVAAVNCVLTGAQKILDGETIVYTLCRPPGHHAAHHTMGGYCFFNNAAIAAHYLSAHGRVAILDIDFHHGNGTQDAFYERKDVLYVSIHATPEERYPYSSGFSEEHGHDAGEGYNYNYPLPIGTTNDTYLNALDTAIQDVADFKPDFLVISAGFDTFSEDPIGGFQLTKEVYREIAEKIHGLTMPTLLVQEGGYNIQNLGQMVANFLSGFQA